MASEPRPAARDAFRRGSRRAGSRQAPGAPPPARSPRPASGVVPLDASTGPRTAPQDPPRGPEAQRPQCPGDPLPGPQCPPRPRVFSRKSPPELPRPPSVASVPPDPPRCRTQARGSPQGSTGPRLRCSGTAPRPSFQMPLRVCAGCHPDPLPGLPRCAFQTPCVSLGTPSGHPQGHGPHPEIPCLTEALPGPPEPSGRPHPAPASLAQLRAAAQNSLEGPTTLACPLSPLKTPLLTCSLYYLHVCVGKVSLRALCGSSLALCVGRHHHMAAEWCRSAPGL